MRTIDRKGRLVRIRVCLLALAAICAGACVLPAVGLAAVAKAPAWQILAATGPTNLPPLQSDVQRLTVGAEGGTFVLSRVSGEGSGTPVVGEGHLTYTAGNPVATIESVASASFEVGARLTGSGIPAGTMVLACSSDCMTAGSTVTLSDAPTLGKTGQKIKIYTRRLSGVTGTFHVGDQVAGRVGSTEYLPPATVVTAVGTGTLTLSSATSSLYFAEDGALSLAASELTAPIAYNATAEAVQSALEALPSLGVGSVTVTGGPGGDVEHPYFIAYGGQLADVNVAQLSVDTEGLTGESPYAGVATTVPGGPGTGEVAVYPTNIGGEESNGEITVEIGPLPTGVVTNAATKSIGGTAWNWSCATEERNVRCTTTGIAPALSPTPAIRFGVEVSAAAPLTATIPVTISGGGAAQPASFQLPIVVSLQPVEPGIAAMYAGALDADGQPSTQAGGHPYSQFTAFALNTRRTLMGHIVPAGDLKDLYVDLPAGFSGDPLVTYRCPASEPSFFGISLTEYPSVCSYEGDEIIGRLWPASNKFGSMLGGAGAKVINDVPSGGAAARFTSSIGPAAVNLVGSVRSEEDFKVRVSSLNTPILQQAYYADTLFYGEPEAAHGKAFFRNPTDCGEEARQTPVVTMQADSYEQPARLDQVSDAQAPVTGCDKLKFEAYDAETKEGQVSFSFQPSSTQGSSPVGAVAHLHIDQSGLTDPGKLATPDLKESVVKLPAGFSINPAQAARLAACSEAQVGYVGEGALPNPTRFDEAPVSCPEASKLGSAEIVTPLLEEPLQGTVYLASQDENPFHSLIALYLVVESERFGITLKLPGKVETDPTTGQVTAVFDYVPQQPVEDITLNFRGGGPRSEFATPEVCGTYTTSGEWTPWSAPESGAPARTEDSFTVSSGCSASAAARPFEPGFEAGTVTPSAGSYSPLVIKLSRKDGEQELTHLDLTLPDGLLGKLAGVERCSDAAIASASSVSGREELAKPSCPEGSLLGAVDAAAGVGSEPLHVPGRIYLAGPYEGGPYSVVVITPAVAGPFDLGDVVVRAPLFVDKTTAQVTARSDAIPTILDGIPLKIRSIAIDIDRPSFTLNPTSCEVMSVTGSATGSSGGSSPLSSRFQVGGCEGLAFKPSFAASTNAKTSRKQGASLTVKLGFPTGAQANLAKAKVQLPLQLPSRLATLKQACTEEQFAKDPAGCPKASIVGSASAVTPILASPLAGPAYFVSHGGAKFPELILVLQGEGITIQLAGETFIAKGITTSTFNQVPDAPVSSFTITLPTGEDSALAAPGGHLCRHKLIMPTTLTAQNGMVLKQNTRIQVQGCPDRLEVVSHRVRQRVLTLRVAVPAAGKLTATGKGIAGKTKTSSGAETLTLKLKEHGKLAPKTKIALAFTPSSGKQRKQLKASVTIRRKG